MNNIFRDNNERKKFLFKKNYSIGERMGLTAAVLLGVPVVILGTLIFLQAILEFFNLPRLGM